MVPGADILLGYIEPLLPLVPGHLALCVADDGHISHPQSLGWPAVVRVVLEPPASDGGLEAGVVLEGAGGQTDGLDLVAELDRLGEGQHGIVPAHVVGSYHELWVDDNLGHSDKLVLFVHPALVTYRHANNTWSLQQYMGYFDLKIHHI